MHASRDDRLDYARQLIRAEAAALEQAAARLGPSFLAAAELLWPVTAGGRGRLAITGTGKSADIGQKLAGTFSSTGTRAYVARRHQARSTATSACCTPTTSSLVLSHSGESDEIVLPAAAPCKRAVPRAIVGVTGSAASSSWRAPPDVALVYGPLDEVCPLGLAPSASTTAMLALGDALAFVLSQAARLPPRGLRPPPPRRQPRQEAGQASSRSCGAASELRLAPADRHGAQTSSPVRAPVAAGAPAR